MDIIKKDYEGGNSQIVLYQPNETISIEVKLDVEYDTVWLTQQQMVELFASSKANISEHISNIFQQCELQPESTVRKFRIVRKEGARTVTRTIDHYNLDVIISVGFRVNSRQGISFRQWANKVLKEYLLRGYAVHQQIKLLERRVDDKLLIQHDEIRQIRERQDRQQEQLDFFIRTSAPPAEMVFFEGDFYTARAALENLVKSALHRVVIDDKLYHCGHSLNANGGHKISAITLMGTSPEVILGQVR